jgi:uncharacterized membrane protein HdeD (DUF308 family)
MIIFGIILLLIGMFHIVMPKKTLEIGRKYLFKDNREPNFGALFFTRMMGVFVVVMSIYAIIKSLK